MIYLSGKEEPTNVASFLAAVEGGLRMALTCPSDAHLVDARGNYPALDQLSIDLSGCNADPAKLPPRPEPRGVPSPGVTAESLAIKASPIGVGGARVSMELIGQGARLDFDRDEASSKLLLVLTACRDGRASFEVSRADLESLMLTEARPLAAQQGANLTDLKLTLTRLGDRSLAIEVRAAAKKFMMNGVVHVIGKVDVGEDLTARLYDLDVRGEGVAGNVAAGFLKALVKQYEGREIPLASYAFKGIRLRDVRIASVDPIRVEAAFGT